MRNDELPWDELVRLAPDNVVISPGPGPARARARRRGLARGAAARRGAGARRLPRPPGARVRRRAARSSTRARSCTGASAGSATTGARCSRASRRTSSPCATTRSWSAPCRRELRVTAWTPDGVIMALEHRARPLFGVQFHPESVSTRHGRALLENFRDLTPRRAPGPPRGRPARRRRAADRRRASAERASCAAARLEAWCEPEAVFGALYADHDHAAWLDSSRTGAGVARFSFIGAPDGPLGQVVRYDVGARTVVVERASGREARAESVFDYCRRELERLRADAPELPFDFVGGFAGYLGFELKAECGGRAAHASPLPDAALPPVRPADRLRPPGAPDPPARADRRRRRRATPTPGSPRPSSGCARSRASRRRCRRRPPPPGTLRLRAPRLARGLPGEHRRLPARDPRGRELRDLPDDGAAERRARSTRCPPTGRCGPATPPRSPRCCGSASCPCSAPRRSGSCASTASASSSRGR